MRSHLVLGTACAAAIVIGWTLTTSRTTDAHWLRVARDSSYDIAIDTTRITSRYGYGTTVWYRTNHAVPHLYKGKPFDRELVQSLLQCGTMKFRIVSVDMSLGNGRLIAQQRTEDGELGRQLWRTVEPNTIEATAAKAACDFAAARSRR